MTGSLDLEISSIARHEPWFEIDRPLGNGRYVFVHFGTPIYLRDRSGIRRYERNASILYGPDDATWYSGIDAWWENVWFHCSGAVDLRVEAYGIPTNTALEIGPLDFLVPMLEGVQREKLRREPFWEASSSLLADDFFCRLGRTIKHKDDTRLTPYQREQEETLRHVREIVHSQLGKNWTVAEMAALASLSSSRFTVLYHAFFGASPMDDLIASRLAHAGMLLQQSALTVAKIADMCGFNSLSHFSRLFRSRRGMSPNDWRRGAHDSHKAE